MRRRGMNSWSLKTVTEWCTRTRVWWKTQWLCAKKTQSICKHSRISQGRGSRCQRVGRSCQLEVHKVNLLPIREKVIRSAKHSHRSYTKVRATTDWTKTVYRRSRRLHSTLERHRLDAPRTKAKAWAAYYNRKHHLDSLTTRAALSKHSWIRRKALSDLKSWEIRSTMQLPEKASTTIKNYFPLVRHTHFFIPCLSHVITYSLEKGRVRKLPL